MFNADSLVSFSDKSRREESWVYLEPGKPVRFGTHADKGIAMRGMVPRVVGVGETGTSGEEELLVHDRGNPSVAQAMCLAELPQPEFPTALGIFRQVQRPTYEDMLMAQIDSATERGGPGSSPPCSARARRGWLIDRGRTGQ